jgi:DNA-directed RNA polymerase specialized sigma24 family protein
MTGRFDGEIFDDLPHVKIAQIAEGYGYQAVYERWNWASDGTLQDSIVYGRGILRRQAGLPPQRPRGRKTTPEQEEQIVGIALARRDVKGAGKAFGVSDELVRTLFFERGQDYPRKNGSQRTASVAIAYANRRLAKGYPPITEESLRADVAARMRTETMAAKYGIAAATLRKHAVKLGVELNPPRADRVVMLLAYEGGESIIDIAKRLDLSTAYVRDCLTGLGAFEPRSPSTEGKKAKARGRLSAATLRADLNEGLRVTEIAQRRGVSTTAVRSLMSKKAWRANRANGRPPVESGRAA